MCFSDTIAPYHYMNWKMSSLARVSFRLLCNFHNKAVDALSLGRMDFLIIDIRSILNLTNKFDTTI